MPLDDEDTDEAEHAPNEEELKTHAIEAHLAGMAQYIQRETGADTVQIIITCHDDKTGVTDMLSKGVGNCYARIESCNRWIENNS